MKKFKYILLIIGAMILWTGVVIYGISEGFLLRPIASDSTPQGFVEAAKKEIDKRFAGSFAMALMENGKVTKQHFYSVDKSVTAQTLFQMASVSKWVTAWGVFTLVESGKLDLDKPVEDYLTRWHLPKSKFDNKQVTVRRLLSHTAGLVDDLGYDGFSANEKVQTLEESLTKAADAGKGYAEGVARVGYQPGTAYRYSGASYTLLQLLIEEVSGKTFPAYMKEAVFDPLQMNQSTFVWSESLQQKLAKPYKKDGSLDSYSKFTALAAASLYTSLADLSKFLEASVSKDGLLSAKSLDLMSKPAGFRNNYGVHGLGPMIYGAHAGVARIIGHDGSSGKPVINTTARVNLDSRDGIIVMEVGNHNLASNLADEWMFAKVGIADYVVIQRNKPYLITLLIGGYIVIILLTLYTAIKKRKERKNTPTAV